MVAEGDPNFPIGGLSIAPSHSSYTSSTSGYQDQQADILQFGIAGRTWEAAYLLTQYLSQPTNDSLVFDPPCSLFIERSQYHCVLELGAGVGVAGMHFGLELSRASSPATNRAGDSLILTDLENVLPLLQRNVKQTVLQDKNADNVSFKVRSLPWGSNIAADTILQELSPQHLTHIICSDLVYFPELLAPLLRSLIYLTSTLSGNVEVIIGYKLRSHSKEEPFWKAFGVWFDFAPVLCKSSTKESEWRRFGSRLCDSGRAGSEKAMDTPAEDEMFVFIAHRKRSTLHCTAPQDDEQLLGGWLLKDGQLERGTGAETFELLLMNAIQD